MIEFNTVTKEYSSKQETGLYHVSFKIYSGEMVFLTGHSGAGKTTLLRLIMLLEKSDYGEIKVGGYALGKLRAGQIPFLRRQIGMVCQEHSLLGDRNLFENVAIPLRVSGFNKTDIPRRVRAALDIVGLTGKESISPLKLSCGEQQRAVIARAIVNRPAILLADEPTGNLDPELSYKIMNLLQRFQKVGTTVLIATHDIEQVKKFNKRVLTLYRGRLVTGLEKSDDQQNS